MLIRQARPEDAHAACQVLRRSIQELSFEDHQGDPTILAEWLANKTPENLATWIRDSHVFVAEEGDAIVGVAAITAAGEITLNDVAPEARFRGVSKALVREVESMAASLGCRTCTLESTKTARRFYLAHGYKTEPGDRGGRMIKAI